MRRDLEIITLTRLPHLLVVKHIKAVSYVIFFLINSWGIKKNHAEELESIEVD